MDPSVRYYMRHEGDSGSRLDRVPPPRLTKEELYTWYFESSSSSITRYKTNAELREEVERGNGHRVRPVPCAVVFLYEGTNHLPEGSVRLAGREEIYVKVIGGVGDVDPSVYHSLGKPLGEYAELNIRMFITKSAGDHNMARVVLLAAYIFVYQCKDVIGLSELPAVPATFATPKTNIPFLCFLRELRDRTAATLEAPESPPLSVDQTYVYGHCSANYLRKIYMAFYEHYIDYIENRIQQRAAKQQQQQSLPNNNSLAGSIRTGSLTSHPSDSDFNANNNNNNNNSSTHTPRSDVFPITPRGRTTLLSSGAKAKVRYVVKGYINTPQVTLSALSGRPHEVYVVCVDSTVRVIEGEVSPDRPDTAAPVPCRHPPPPRSSQQHAPPPTVLTEIPDDGEIEVDRFVVCRGDILSFKEPFSFPSSDEDDDSMANVEDTVKENNNQNNNNNAWSTPHKGRWTVDPHVFLESVLLSLVRDECRNAREAEETDEGWVRLEEGEVNHHHITNTNNGEEIDEHPQLAHSGSFYVWRFKRGRRNFLLRDGTQICESHSKTK
ncbi:hypothetical protein, conserved [Angomonas deanei]|uniref:Uncharacterized protein n=1 Tax=Angomonas deanei TaxID=59799 RepID=A0A7G2C515_9TRYP|nr:hypothetical protein, conserved [Angomonas deanei]